ncbi:zinc-dependent metalloprotease [Sphingobium sp. H39-3-25]|uniref:zinc-dependent metalloprotease n=1 Tax=Sphingobium arseniciresistens TaxID=3030834 RepID=UPI0023B8C480|nr:zinc-dependent metalloprotease [Sphingobium arseniciresistens]
MTAFRIARARRMALVPALALALAASSALPAIAIAQTSPAKPAEGALLPVKVIANEGKVLITLPAPDKDGYSGRFLYATSLRTGLGSPNMRLDHGGNGPTQMLAFRRLGKKVTIVFEQPEFRHTGGSADVQKGVSESFATSTVWAGDIVSTEAGGGLVVDITSFLTRDVMDIAGRLNRDGKGYKMTDGLSLVDPQSVKVFPDNIEIDALQTFQSDAPGPEVMAMTPEPRQVSFTVHHSLIRLPELGYTPREFDIRAGGFSTQVYDFSRPLGQDLVHQLANRYRLEKVDPSAARSRVKKPIIYYIDTAAPEPIRQALYDGVKWWSDAFDAAGFIDGFQVKMLPEGADPLDVRYNVVNWTNRYTRGWSYGQVIADPRTGEIVKGSVVLGSLRVRQDMVIFEGLAGATNTGKGGPQDPVEASLARIRQLGAHEVGHAIGFMHNFAASIEGRASVMDYPGPLVKVTDGAIDISDAYASGIGEWDKVAVDWLYGQAAPGVDPDADAKARLASPKALGMRFMTDVDGRSPDAPSPWTSMWDNGADPVAELVRLMEVRKVAIARFGPGVLRAGEPLAEMRRKFVPVWLFHRYQVDAAAKLVGGIDYAYAVAGDGRPAPVPVSAAAQNAALDALMATLSPANLTVPDALTLQLSSGLQGATNKQFEIEVFNNAGPSAFDPLVAADVGAQVTLSTLLAPSRLRRLFEQHRRDSSMPGVEALLDRLFAASIDNRTSAVARRIAYRTAIEIARAARDKGTSPEVAGILSARLVGLSDRLAKLSGSSEDAVWGTSLARLLRDGDGLEQELAKKPRAPEIPPGMPIGGAQSDWMESDWSDGLLPS